MKIHRSINLRREPERHREKMLTVLRRPASFDVRPCRGCVQPCSAHWSTTCPCQCSYACPYAPAELSSDPVRYPIEPRILPLVFELNAMKVVQPCWSCEGHLGPDEAIKKLPSVWFYVDDTDYAVLLNRYLMESYAARRTQVPWIVTLSLGPEDPAFACRPDVWGRFGDVTLKELQADALALAQDLREYTQQIARAEIAEIDQRDDTKLQH